MDFAFTEEQQMLGDSVRSFLADRYPLDEVARLATEERPQLSLKEMAGLGWTGLSVEEDLGGSGMGFLEEAVVFEELGYGLYPGPFFSTVGLALLLAGADLRGEIASQGRAVTVAWAEEPDEATFQLGVSISTKVASEQGTWRVTGEKQLVVDAISCDAALVVASAESKVGLWKVALDAEGVTVDETSTMDTTRRYGRLSLEAAEAEPVSPDADLAEAIAATRTRALAALALEAVGIGRRVLALTVEHAKERKQFDKPIGAYQAISQRLADMYMETELARSLAYWAAWTVDAGEDVATQAAHAAKAFSADAAVRSCERAIQIHGGIGFTWDHILHRFYKRAHWIEAFDGFGPSHRAAVAEALLA